MTTPDTPAPDAAVKAPTPFWSWLRQQRDGRTHAELTDALAAVTRAALEHRKPGRLTLTITVKPGSKGQDGVLFVSDQITLKVPAGERGEFIFYADEAGNLSRRDPRQPELPGITRAPAPDFDTDTGEIIAEGGTA